VLEIPFVHLQESLRSKMLIFGFIIVVLGGALFFAGTITINRNEKKYGKATNDTVSEPVSGVGGINKVKDESDDQVVYEIQDDQEEVSNDEDFLELLRSGVGLIRVAGIVLVLVGGVIMLLMNV
jgi:hypothetical protein